MVLFRRSFVLPSNYLQYDFAPYFDTTGFILLVITTVLVAAGGYVINDVFDVEIDAINKPHKRIVETKIPELSAFNFYKLLVLAAIFFVILLSIHQKEYKISSIPIFVMAFLYMYALQFKKQLLIGNIVVALCTAVPLLMIAFYEFKINYSDTETIITITKGILYAAIAYGVFAFMTTLCREIAKDIEDMEGDATEGAQTLPIVIGLSRTKISLLLLHVVLLIFHGFILYFEYILEYQKMFYMHLFILFVPCILLTIILFLSKQNNHFGRLSAGYKVYQAMGIVSMWYFHLGTGSYFFVILVNQLQKWL
jgi:4-hydroxybenzoate polyprenyltransferase